MRYMKWMGWFRNCGKDLRIFKEFLSILTFYIKLLEIPSKKNLKFMTASYKGSRTLPTWWKCLFMIIISIFSSSKIFPYFLSGGSAHQNQWGWNFLPSVYQSNLSQMVFKEFSSLQFEFGNPKESTLLEITPQ